MRGKVQEYYNKEDQLRITPAHAGKSSSPGDTTKVSRDHPRACGEKGLRLLPRCLLPGSPPRMRGKGVPAPAHNPPSGITPAHAGKSYVLRFHQVFRQDHPRACGEKYSNMYKILCAIGSPPRMRGKAEGNNIDRTLAGITPAHAGKRTIPSDMKTCKKDHPRACGEKPSAI